MSWLANRSFRSVTDRAVERFMAEVPDVAKAKTLALAVANACYPKSIYGDKDRMDEMLQMIGRVATTPCDPATALMLVKQWEAGSLNGMELFERVWGLEIDTFIGRVVERMPSAR